MIRSLEKLNLEIRKTRFKRIGDLTLALEELLHRDLILMVLKEVVVLT
jgi:hypothetical protein